MKNGEVVSQGSEPVVRWHGPPRPGFVPPASCANIVRLGNRPLFCRTSVPTKQKPAFPEYSCFDALAFRLLEGLGVQETGWRGRHDAGSQGP